MKAFKSYGWVTPMQSIAMHALRLALGSLPEDARSAGVRQLLQALPSQEFQLAVHICSFGGVGSTELSNFLNRHGITTNLLNDNDSMRHVNRPPAYGSERPRAVLYLYGDPLASMASHYRRGQALHQALKTSGNPHLLQAAFPPSAEAYVQGGQDLFGYEQHFNNWRHARSGYDIVMARYEQLWEPGVCLQLLRLVAGHRKAEAELRAMAEEFCAGRRQRRSEVAPEWREGLYQRLQAAMDALPALLVRGPDGSIREAYGVDGSPLLWEEHWQSRPPCGDCV